MLATRARQEHETVDDCHVQSAADMARVQDELERLIPDRLLAIAAKVETALAVRNLPVLVGSPRDELRETA